MNNKELVTNQAGDCPNDLAQLRAAQSENNMKDESGALAAAPCSACGREVSEHDSPSKCFGVNNIVRMKRFVGTEEQKAQIRQFAKDSLPNGHPPQVILLEESDIPHDLLGQVQFY